MRELKILLITAIFLIPVSCYSPKMILNAACVMDEKSRKPYRILLSNVTPVSHFNIPVGYPDGEGYYNAQRYRENGHLGDDWNGNGGGDTDLGDNIYAIADGYVSEVKDYGGGWGKVIRIVHPVTTKGEFIESVYGHILDFKTKKNRIVRSGDIIGTMGNSNGRYKAHLHFELRSIPDKPMAAGYTNNPPCYQLDPAIRNL